MNKNKISHPALIIWSAIIALLVLSAVKLPVIPYINSYSHIDLLQDLKADNKPIVKRAQPRKVANKKDSSITAAATTFNDSSLISDYSDNSAATMNVFYTRLNNLKKAKGKVRIAYFGDSYIEADYVTGELRDKMQHIYGGNGVGFLPMQSVVAGDYQTVKFGNTTSWTDNNYHSNPQKHALGLMGHVFYANGSASTQYGAVNNNTFKNIYLITGKTPDSSVAVNVEADGVEAKVTVAGSAAVNKTLLNSVPVSKVKISCSNTNLPVYGVSIEDSTGVYIDNYGFRGNTGALSLQLQADIMKGFQDNFKYDLIIIHYGLNVVAHNDTNFLWFDNTMARLIEKVKTNCPNVPILLISTSDMSYNEQGTYITDPAVPVLVRTQNKIAQKNKVAFWNLYYAMGGEGTMADWVEGDTTYAYKDYMHVNERGANKVAGILLDKLLHSQKN